MRCRDKVREKGPVCVCVCTKYTSVCPMLNCFNIIYTRHSFQFLPNLSSLHFLHCLRFTILSLGPPNACVGATVTFFSFVVFLFLFHFKKYPSENVPEYAKFRFRTTLTFNSCSIYFFKFSYALPFCYNWSHLFLSLLLLLLPLLQLNIVVTPATVSYYSLYYSSVKLPRFSS